MKRKTLDTMREIRLWIAVGIGAVAAFPEARAAVVDKVKKIKLANYPGKIRDKIHEITRKKD